MSSLERAFKVCLNTILMLLKEILISLIIAEKTENPLPELTGSRGISVFVEHKI